MVPSVRREGEPPPVYGDDSDEFTVELHHGGFFVGQGLNRAYLDQKVSWFDHCEADSWSLLWIQDFLEELGYLKSACLKVYWLLLGKDLSDGLRIVCSDGDSLLMMSLVKKVKNFVLYVDHDDTIVGLHWDDIVANPVVSLPKLLNPKKVEVVERSRNEKLPSFYSNLERMTSNKAQHFVDSESEGSDSEDMKFVDGDYDLENDDDLFVDNVDEDVVDEGIAKGRKIGKGVKATGCKGKGRVSVDEDLSTDEDELQELDSDGEGQLRMGFQSFRSVDIQNPIFKVGILFESVELLRKAIIEYSLKKRVDIKILRNERKRIRAHCAEGCPWNLYASHDSRANGLVVKTYCGEHNCQKYWILKRCPTNWLAEKIVQKDWNMTPSRTKLTRARRLAMKAVLGDEEDQYKLLWDFGHELRRSNPGNTFFLTLADSNFSTMYMSIDACKRGFLSACRPIICLDGCYIKTKYEVESLASWK
uniref:Uncharacterized protein n=1 Tax=Setaria italica TaxID=4555 RepID=K3ZLZ1_SETIT